MRQSLRVAALVLALGCPVFAGHTTCPPEAPPTPPPTSAVQAEPDEAQTDVTASIVKIVLDLLTLL